MFTLTATGLIVGAIVSEREQVTLDYHQAEKQLRKKEIEAAKMGRLNFVSGMASALAHEINQPITAARAFARAVQHLLREPDPDWPRVTNNLSHLIAQIDVAGDIVRRIREFLQRGQLLMNRISVYNLLMDAMISH